MISLAKPSIRSPWARAWMVVGILLSVRTLVDVRYAGVLDRPYRSAQEESR